MKRFWLYLGLATAVGAVFLWLAARELPWGDVMQWLGDEDPVRLATWFGAFAVVYGICHASRVVRWYELVRPLGDVEPNVVHRVCTVGFTAILLLPFRLGELVRPYLLARRTSFGMTPILGTAVVERVVDGLTVTGLLFLTLATYDGDQSPEFAKAAGWISAAIFVPALLICLLALWSKERASKLVRVVGGVVSQKIAERLADLLEAFIDGFRALAGARSLGRFAVLTAIYWAANIGSMWLLASFGFGIDIGPWEMASVMTILVLGIMIPAGPAMAGNFEYFILRGLSLFVVLEGADALRAGAFAASLHVLQFAVIVIPGFVVMWLDPEARHLIRLSQQADEATEG